MKKFIKEDRILLGSQIIFFLPLLISQGCKLAPEWIVSVAWGL